MFKKAETVQAAGAGVVQTVTGDNAAATYVAGDFTVNYGLTREQYQEQLREQAGELVKAMQSAGFIADARQLHELERKHEAVSAKLADIERSYEEELARRKAADAALAQLRGQLPEAQIENAQANLRQGDKDAAKSVFHGVLDKEGASVALAAYQLGQMAEGDLNYAEAMRMYKKAVALEEDNPEYLLAAGKMARKLAQYRQAQDWLEHLREIREAEGENAEIGFVLNELALVYHDQCRHETAEHFYQLALTIKKQVLDKDDRNTAAGLNNLAEIYSFQGKYGKAESLYLQSLKIREKTLGEKHPDVAQSLNNLAGLYEDQSRYTEAEPLYLRSLTIFEQEFGKEHPDMATSLNNMAGLYIAQRRYTEAEPLYLRSLSTRERILGKNHPHVASSLNNLAGLYRQQRRYDEAELLYKKSLMISEKTFGKDHPAVAITLNNLAWLYYEQGRYEEAEPLYQQAIAILKANFPNGHPNIDAAQANYDKLKQKMAEQG